MLAKPIFAPDRKPDESAVPVAGGMDGFFALGIALAGDTATALVRGPGGTVQRLKPGEAINGWKLVAVSLDQLTFERNKERRVLTILKAPAAVAGRVRAERGHGAQFGQPDNSDNSDNSDKSDNSDDSDEDSDQ